MVRNKLSVLLVVLCALSVPIAAQNLNVPKPGAPVLGSVPSRGMTMQQVEKSYGAPATRRASVGDPPITRWEYNGFVVYFEYKHVIHSVPKH